MNSAGASSHPAGFGGIRRSSFISAQVRPPGSRSRTRTANSPSSEAYTLRSQSASQSQVHAGFVGSFAGYNPEAPYFLFNSPSLGPPSGRSITSTDFPLAVGLAKLFGGTAS